MSIQPGILELAALGRSTDHESFQGLETIPLGKHITKVAFTCTEVTALCPITKNQDLYRVTIEITQSKKTLESKSLKYFLHSLRNRGIFAEHLAEEILIEVEKVLRPAAVKVTVVQQSRGGISIRAVAFSPRQLPPEPESPPTPSYLAAPAVADVKGVLDPEPPEKML